MKTIGIEVYISMNGHFSHVRAKMQKNTDISMLLEHFLYKQERIVSLCIYEYLLWIVSWVGW